MKGLLRIVAIALGWVISAVGANAQSAHLYWTEYRYSDTDPEARFGELFSVHRADVADIAGTQAEVLHALPYQPEYNGLGARYGIAYVRPFGHTSGVDSYGFAGGDFVFSLQAAMEGSGTPIDSVGQYTYAPGEGGIYRGNYEGENRELLIPTPPYRSLDIALDEPRGHIYWITTCNGCGLTLGRANLDGSNVQSQVLPVLADDYPADLAIDTAARKLYWNDLYAGTVQRADLDGTNIETVLTNAAVFSLSIDANPVPEPSGWALLVAAIAAAATRAGKRVFGRNP
jgi:hypothetical protein